MERKHYQIRSYDDDRFSPGCADPLWCVMKGVNVVCERIRDEYTANLIADALEADEERKGA